MVGNYVIIFVMILAILALGLALLSIGVFLRPHRPTPRKLAPYESGVPNVEPLRGRYTPRFYVIAILFVIFDIEAIFLYPWAVVYKEMLLTNANLIFGSMVSFLGILFVGYIYALKKGAFDWKK